MRGLSCFLLIALIAILLTGCKPSSSDLENQRAEREDKISAEDGQQLKGKYDPMTQQVFKVNGRVFVISKQYGGFNASAAFAWPSKSPIGADNYPERELVTSGKADLVQIEFFIERTTLQAPLSPNNFQKATRPENIAHYQIIRPGLEEFELKPNSGGFVHYWYVATEYKTPTSQVPPVAFCDSLTYVGDRCTGGFLWQPGLMVSYRIPVAYRKDWPEIYAEIIKVLNQIKEIK